MSMEALRKALENKLTDGFEDGDVIRWVSSGRYLYAAIKTPVGWFTTAASYNTFVGQILTFDELVEVLQRAETTDVAFATGWTFL